MRVAFQACPREQAYSEHTIYADGRDAGFIELVYQCGFAQLASRKRVWRFDTCEVVLRSPLAPEQHKRLEALVTAHEAACGAKGYTLLWDAADGFSGSSALRAAKKAARHVLAGTPL